MIHIILVGAAGRMGQTLVRLIANSNVYRLVWSKEKSGHNQVKSCFPEQVKPKTVIVDFSSPMGTVEAANFAREKNIPLVSGTTGLNENDISILRDISISVPVFYASNMSLGIAILSKLVRQTALYLKGKADTEIIEYHHSRKADAPSGTALSLAKNIQKVQDDTLFVFGRRGRTGPRKKEEIGIHAIRAGNIVGRHDVLFGLPEEIITLSHTTLSRDTFAKGALEAVKFIVNKEPGFYTMDNLLQEMNELKQEGSREFER